MPLVGSLMLTKHTGNTVKTAHNRFMFEIRNNSFKQMKQNTISYRLRKHEVTILTIINKLSKSFVTLNLKYNSKKYPKHNTNSASETTHFLVPNSNANCSFASFMHSFSSLILSKSSSSFQFALRHLNRFFSSSSFWT